MASLKNLSNEVKQYLIVTANYWAFTITDGALRMLVVLYFHQQGYEPLQIALLFMFYEFFGVVTNLLGGWLGARLGLNRIMNFGLAIQICALCMLLVPTQMLSIIWVMVAQALSGIAKDLNKMSAKSAIKLLVSNSNQQGLYKWVALLTGSKNALKGFGFFVGGALLALFGFQIAILSMACVLFCVWVFSVIALNKDLGRSKEKLKFTQIFSKESSVNTLALARFFLFGSRDVWFVVALPIFLISSLGWSSSFVGAFLASWIIAYGIVQSLSPVITGRSAGKVPDGRSLVLWAGVLAVVTGVLSASVYLAYNPLYTLLPGLLIFGAVFAINSSMHSYLIVSYADSNHVSMDVGFYYMANASGRLVGTMLSGFLYQRYGLAECLFVSTVFIVISALGAMKLPSNTNKSINV